MYFPVVVGHKKLYHWTSWWQFIALNLVLNIHVELSGFRISYDEVNG